MDVFLYGHCSYVFWFGDLNFRVDQFTRRELEDLISQREYDKMLQEDQVCVSRLEVKVTARGEGCG